MTPSSPPDAVREALRIVRGVAELSILISDFDKERALIEAARSLVAKLDSEALALAEKET